ncbi:MAG: hypothetical protein ACQGVC_05820 [Myxococcota bacterium]
MRLALNGLCGTPGSASWSNREWTTKVKEALAKAGRARGYQVFASSASGVDGGEWLFDLCWLSYRGEWLVDAPLVVESEWLPHSLDDDFQKLLVARAKLRLMVFPARNSEAADALFERFEASVKRFSAKEGRFLLACWRNDTERFHYRRVAAA